MENASGEIAPTAAIVAAAPAAVLPAAADGPPAARRPQRPWLLQPALQETPVAPPLLPLPPPLELQA
jgi:hypothetical protein